MEEEQEENSARLILYSDLTLSLYSN
jgi:hypothetical protein